MPITTYYVKLKALYIPLVAVYNSDMDCKAILHYDHSVIRCERRQRHDVHRNDEFGRRFEWEGMEARQDVVPYNPPFPRNEKPNRHRAWSLKPQFRP